VFVYDLPTQFNLDNYLNFTVWRDQDAHPHAAGYNGKNIFEIAAQHRFYAAEVRLHEALLPTARWTQTRLRFSSCLCGLARFFGLLVGTTCLRSKI